jgi:hypothetical protein
MTLDTRGWKPLAQDGSYFATPEGKIMRVTELALATSKRSDQLRVGLRTRRSSYMVSRLVCEAFNGPPPPDKPWCLHRDGDDKNNRPENLYWGTPQENSDDRIAHGNSGRGENNGKAIVTETMVHMMRQYTKDGWSDYKIAAHFGVSRSCVSGIRRGRTWGWLE